MKYKLLIILIIVIGCTTPNSKNENNTQAVQNKYEDNWESLSNHNEDPEWFKDAKFGIYFHWGVYSVPAFKTEWYPRHMHIKKGWSDGLVHKHHVKTFGHPEEFGYHDFIPMFKAENFNADEWAELFAKTGARFAGPVAEHHDGFSMWDSEHTPWNASDKGPKRDLTAELEKSIKKQGMKFITTFHHARNNLYQNEKGEWTGHYDGIIKDSFPSLLKNEQNAILYGYMPRDKFLEMWKNKLFEVVDKYQPDIIWFDSWLDQIPEKYRQEFCSYYLNAAENWNKEVVIIRKQDDLPLDCSVDDLEKSRKNKLEDKVWMTDETISKGSWCYTEDLQIKEAKDVLHVLIDIVSKNGVLLLNVSPMADGTIPDNQKDVLLKMGAWLNKHGEAIYETRPWYTFGEGPTVEPEGIFQNHEEFLKIKYSEKDIRYTTKENVIYAIVLGKPDALTEVMLESFAADKLPEPIMIKQVSILNSDKPIYWDLNKQGLLLKISDKYEDEMAQAFKIEYSKAKTLAN